MTMEFNISNEKDRIRLKRVAKALCDLKRLEILGLILKDEYNNLNYGKISEKIERSPTSITNHMKWLRQSKLIEDLIMEGKRGKMQKIPQLKFKKIIINFD